MNWKQFFIMLITAVGLVVWGVDRISDKKIEHLSSAYIDMEVEQITNRHECIQLTHQSQRNLEKKMVRIERHKMNKIYIPKYRKELEKLIKQRNDIYDLKSGSVVKKRNESSLY